MLGILKEGRREVGSEGRRDKGEKRGREGGSLAQEWKVVRYELCAFFSPVESQKRITSGSLL